VKRSYPEQELKQRLETRERTREAKAARNRRKKHPCPTCEAHGRIRRSFGFGYPGDLNSEAYAILPCPTCHGTGAQPLEGAVVVLRRGERPLPWWEDVVDGEDIPVHLVDGLERLQRKELAANENGSIGILELHGDPRD
jgi:hypothetical protein